MSKYPQTGEGAPRKFAPATTIEGCENQMSSLALVLAEKRLRNGTATAQEIVYFAKQGSTTAKTELQILKKQEELLAAKTEAIRSSQQTDAQYAEVIAALRSYGGNPDRCEYEN